MCQILWHQNRHKHTETSNSYILLGMYLPLTDTSVYCQVVISHDTKIDWVQIGHLSCDKKEIAEEMISPVAMKESSKDWPSGKKYISSEMEWNQYCIWYIVLIEECLLTSSLATIPLYTVRMKYSICMIKMYMLSSVSVFRSCFIFLEQNIKV